MDGIFPSYVMSILYRAMWQAGSEDLIKKSGHEFRSWVIGKHAGLEVPDSGESATDRADVRVTEGQSELGAIKRWVLHEDDGKSRWITTLSAMHEHGAPEGWVWIDVENVSTSYTERVDVASPRLARTLLNTLPSSHRGPLTLKASEMKLGPREMADFLALLQHPERDLPIVVFSPDYGADPQTTIERARRAALTLSGLCQVHLLVPQGEAKFRSTLGHDLAVWAGACRIYLPGVNLDSPDPRRHRYFLLRNLGTHPRAAGLRIANYLSSFVTRQRAPDAYVKLRSLLDPDLQSTIDELWEEVERQTEENKQLDDDRRNIEGSYIDAATEVEELNNQLTTVRHEYIQLWTAAEAEGVLNKIESRLRNEESSNKETTSEPKSCSEAAALAREHLPNISLPESACKDLDRLDQAIEVSAWAKAAWRGFVALDTYARITDAGGGGFHQWCASSGHPHAWPANSKKLAMVESETVRQVDKLREARELPVSNRVHHSGRVFMEAHLKIATGGGPLAPRIYFFDDTAGSTGKIHIGFFGPHAHMPNKQTN